MCLVGLRAMIKEEFFYFFYMFRIRIEPNVREENDVST
jgi:hypothetical protein